MTRSFYEWWKTLPEDLKVKVRKDDDSEKILLNQINWLWVYNIMHNKPELNPTAEEMLFWIESKQIESMRTRNQK